MPYRRKARRTSNKPYRRRGFKKKYSNLKYKKRRWTRSTKSSSSKRRTTPGNTVTGTSYIKVAELVHRFNVNGWKWDNANNDWSSPSAPWKNGTFKVVNIDPGKILELSARAGLYSMYRVLSCTYVFKRKILEPLPVCIWSEKFHVNDFGVVFPNTKKHLIPAAPTDESNAKALLREAWALQQTRSKKFDVRCKKFTKPVRNSCQKIVSYSNIGEDDQQELTIPGGRPWLELKVEFPVNMSTCEAVVFLPDIDYEATSDKAAAHAMRQPNVPAYLFKDRVRWDVYAYVKWQVKGRFLDQLYAHATTEELDEEPDNPPPSPCVASDDEPEDVSDLCEAKLEIDE